MKTNSPVYPRASDVDSKFVQRKWRQQNATENGLSKVCMVKKK